MLHGPCEIQLAQHEVERGSGGDWRFAEGYRDLLRVDAGVSERSVVDSDRHAEFGFEPQGDLRERSVLEAELGRLGEGFGNPVVGPAIGGGDVEYVARLAGGFRCGSRSVT